MKTIDIDDELYQFIASHTQHIGESASDILRRMLNFSAKSQQTEKPTGNSDCLQDLLNSDDFINDKKVVNRFMSVLSTLYKLNNQAFAEAADALKGRTRIYFAFDEKTLLQSGNHTKPKMIPDSPYWVITNTNSARKRMMVEQMMSHMGLSKPLSDRVCQYL